MTVEKPSNLVPKLRFPEFRDTTHWYNTPLGELAHVIAGQSPRGEYYNTTGNGIPFYQGKADFGEQYLKKPTKWTTQVTKLIQPSDILMSVRAPVGALNIAKERICIGRGLAGLQARCDNWFLYYSLLGQQGQIVGNGGSVFDSINKKQIEELLILTPPTIAEQQKIADCLGSVDDLIVAESRKIEALRQHKQGLMQQIFPRPGDTEPNLRFPEFHNDGNWGSKKLGQVCRISTGKKDANEGCSEGPYPFFTCAEKHIFSNSYSFDTEAILVAGNANVGHASYYKGKFEAYQRTYVLTEFADIDVRYLFSILSNCLRPTLLSQVQTSAMSYIRLPMLQAYELKVPKSFNEQRKIADCLGSIDDMIVAESRKLESLQFQKQGLMQQLFPSLDHN
ncbi:MAG: restriction endonuclease subunit S [Gemmatimonadota bacterium]|nr:restriction endonuclease subunit S [Gemmatimonadota bacterium]